MIPLPNDLSNPLIQMTQANQAQNPAATLVQPTAQPAVPTSPEVQQDTGQNALPGLPMTRPGSFGDKLSKALTDANIPRVPGGGLAAVAGAGITALSGITKNLGDAASGPVTPGGSGILEGITQTLANRNNRQGIEQDRAAKLKQQEFENQQTVDRNKALNAYTQAQTVSLQRAMTRADQEAQDAHIASGRVAGQALEKAGHQVAADNINEDQLRAGGIGPGQKYDASKYIAYQTGSQPVEKDGKIVEENTYSLYNRQGDPVVLDDKMANALSSSSTQKFTPGQELSPEQFDSVWTRHQTVQAAADLIDAENAKEDGEKLNRDKIKQNADDLALLVPIIGSHASDPITALQAQARQVDPKTGQPTPSGAAAQRVITNLFTSGELLKHNEEVQKNRIEELKTKKDAAGKMDFTGDPSKNGQEYLDSLSPDAKSLVQEAGTGRMVVSNFGYLLSRNPQLGAAIAKAYPTLFDGSKMESYGKLYQDYVSGATGKALVAAGTALSDLQDLHDINSDPLSFVYGTDSYRRRQQVLDQVAPEVARFNVGGTSAPDKESIERMRDSLGQMTPINANSALYQAASHMQNRINEYQNHWQQGEPSKLYEAPMPSITPQALAAANYLSNNGKYVVTSPDGKTKVTFPDRGKAESFYSTLLKNQPANIATSEEEAK